MPPPPEIVRIRGLHKTEAAWVPFLALLQNPMFGKAKILNTYHLRYRYAILLVHRPVSLLTVPERRGCTIPCLLTSRACHQLLRPLTLLFPTESTAFVTKVRSSFVFVLYETQQTSTLR